MSAIGCDTSGPPSGGRISTRHFIKKPETERTKPKTIQNPAVAAGKLSALRPSITLWNVTRPAGSVLIFSQAKAMTTDTFVPTRISGGCCMPERFARAVAGHFPRGLRDR